MSRKTRTQLLARYNVKELLSPDDKERLDAYFAWREAQAESRRRRIAAIAQRRPSA